jgi:hypothetical protein
MDFKPSGAASERERLLPMLTNTRGLFLFILSRAGASHEMD